MTMQDLFHICFFPQLLILRIHIKFTFFPGSKAAVVTAAAAADDKRARFTMKNMKRHLFKPQKTLVLSRVSEFLKNIISLHFVKHLHFLKKFWNSISDFLKN